MFNKEQIEAINHKGGPMVVVAGPGSGKTTVTVNRIAKLIEDGIDPNNILVITFTKAAAKEMENRFYKMVNNESIPVTFGTIHSISLKILVESFHYSYENVLAQNDKKAVLRKAIDKYHIYTEDINMLVKNIENAISLIKTGILKEPYTNMEYGCRPEQLSKVYSYYVGYCNENNKIDYDDMQLKCIELLKSDKKILAYWRERYQYISVDEFQDVDTIQAELIYLLAKPQNNLFIVGDDDQSLYRFRGAKPEIMLHFEKQFNAKKITLDTNYRSGEKIVGISSLFIKANKVRFDKDFKAVNKKGSIKIKGYTDVQEQAKKIVEDILSDRKKGKDINDLAIIYRTNSESSAILAQLVKNEVPFVAKVENVINIFNHWIFNDIKVYYDIVEHYRKYKDFSVPATKLRRALMRPTRYIPGEALRTSKCLEDIEAWGRIHRKPYIARNIDKFKMDIRALSRLKLTDFLDYFVYKMNYYEAVINYADYNKQDDKELINVLNEILESAQEFDDFNAWCEYAKTYSFTLEDNSKENKTGVHLLTMHGCKGLEFEKVYIIDANEGITPYAYKGKENDEEEERRMFYVAFTRAKNYVNISYVTKGNQTKVSRFVTELNNILAS